NHTVTFTTPDVTKGIKALLAAMDQDQDRDTMLARVASANRLETDFVTDLFEMLEASHCLYCSGSEPKVSSDTDDLWDYFASIGESPAKVKQALEATRPIILTSEVGHKPLLDALTASGVIADVVPL